MTDLPHQPPDRLASDPLAAEPTTDPELPADAVESTAVDLPGAKPRAAAHHPTMQLQAEQVETLPDMDDRKAEHLRVSLDDRVQRPGRGNGLGAYQFDPLSLPELDLDQVDTSCVLLGKRLRAPILVGAMTGGTAEAGAVNRILAEAAERCGVGFCLGSQRPMLGLSGDAVRSFQMRDVAPTTLLLGNLGAIQVRDHCSGKDLERLAMAVGADGMFVHLNPLQEAIQPEGDRDWRGVFDALGEVAASCALPVLVKEVGAGLSAATLQRLRLLGIAGVETAGVGGTSWAFIEALRHRGRTPQAIAGEVLADFGTCTADSLVLARSAFANRVVIASGGLRDGLEVAKCIALGASACALAAPLLRAARHGVDAVAAGLAGIIETLRITMFLVGAPDILQLSRTPIVRVAPGHLG
ncbi:MAG: type 2 isopentenyl-diphosphate Delta-isomerase [Deltaproteobacteria bacterium]|nr:type 2 isopentenyl-diphosphate Delta-isomerase [Deltaproteobacteria bacterium]